MTSYPHIFEPVDIGKLHMENRIIMPAMHMNTARDGYITETFREFYAERAGAGPGPGLIIIGGCYPEKRGMGAPDFVAIDDDRYISGLREFTDRMHSLGSSVAAQLYHAGRYAYSFVIGEQPVSASAVPSRLTGETPRELSQAEIDGVQEKYALAAARAKESGFDAVELICAAGYLVNQFLSALTNRRDDRYGGDLEHRMTFLLETISRIKEATGDDYPLICRVSGSDFMEGGNTLEETRAVAAAMEKAGVDLISVTGGWHETRVPQITMNVPRGAYVYLAEGVKDAVENTPVACCNRINNPDLAESVLAEGRADLVAMGRAFIADPLILRKSLEGRPEDIRPCIACNQGCFDHLFMLKPVSCLMNPRVNRESETTLEPAAVRRRVLVAGGGPGGMEAARVAARRGHDVVLAEKAGRLGGQGLLAGVPPGREEWNEMVRYLSHAVESEGVDVRLNTPVDASFVEEVGPDLLIIATGAKQIVPPVEGVEGDNVVQAWDVLDGVCEAGDRVVVVGGGAVGIETGMYLAERGRSVKVLEMAEKLGRDIGLSTRWTILQDARRLGVEMVDNCCVERITGEGVLAVSGGETVLFEADTVVIATGSQPDESVEPGVFPPEWDIETVRVGDCASPRKAIEAIAEGFEAGLKA